MCGGEPAQMRMMMCIVQQNEGMGMKGEVVVPDNDVLLTTLARQRLMYLYLLKRNVSHLDYTTRRM